MKKFLIVLSILLLITASYFTYHKWLKNLNLTLWSFIPSDAAFVIEGKIMEDITSMKEYPVWNFFNESSGLRNFVESLSFLDSVNGDGGFSANFKQTPILVSAHKISTDKIDFLFAIKLQNIPQSTFAKVVIERLENRGYSLDTRNYNDFQISEISNQEKTLTFVFYEDFFVASFTPYLVEDAIRARIPADITSFQTKFPLLFETKTDENINIYVNFKQAEELLLNFSNHQLDLPLQSGKYELTMDSTLIQVSGFSEGSATWKALHKTQPSSFDMAMIIPENTAYFYHITSLDFYNWQSTFMEKERLNDLEMKNFQDSLKNSFDFDVTEVYTLIKDEIGVAYLESPQTSYNQKLLILEVKDMDKTLDFFDQIHQRIALERGDANQVTYNKDEIRFFPIQNFPFALLGDLATGFDQVFYVNYHNFLIFSNDFKELKALIKSIQNENTWGKSIRMNNFLNRTNQASNVGIYINVPRTWNILMNNLEPSWNTHFNQNASIYQSIELAAFQYSYLDNHFFTNYTFTQPINAEIKKNIPKSSPANKNKFNNKLISKPYLLKTHIHKGFNMMLQDETYALHYLDPSQKELWTKNLRGQIKGEIYLIDYYKNNKIQYLFATNQKIHIIDRNGTYVPGFPKNMFESKTIEHINLIDYDVNKNYRIAVTDTEGNIFLADKNLNPLNGWSPKKFRIPSLFPLKHKRLGGKDLMISLQENGVINIMNRRGEFRVGFPFDSKNYLDNNYFIRSSNSLTNSSLTVISKRGELTEINLEGDLIKQVHLLKNRADASFRIIPDRSKNSFIIIKKEGNSYEVLDDTGNFLFKKEYPQSHESILVQYYQFGAGKDFIFFTDKKNKTLDLYDKLGNPIIETPLNSEHEVSLIYYSKKNEFHLFTTWDRNLEKYTFK